MHLGTIIIIFIFKEVEMWTQKRKSMASNPLLANDMGSKETQDTQKSHSIAQSARQENWNCFILDLSQTQHYLLL